MSVLRGLTVVVTRVHSFTHPTIRIAPFQPTSRGYISESVLEKVPYLAALMRA